jgi:hypothetical protein
MRRPAILLRFPRFFRLRALSFGPLPPDFTEDYPALADDIELANRVVGPAYLSSDRTATILLNQFRRQQVSLLIGSAVVSGLGGLQAVFPEERWPGILLALLGLVLATIGKASNEMPRLEAALAGRLKCDRLQSEALRFIMRIKPYDKDGRERVLKRRVVYIEVGDEELS